MISVDTVILFKVERIADILLSLHSCKTDFTSNVELVRIGLHLTGDVITMPFGKAKEPKLIHYPSKVVTVHSQMLYDSIRCARMILLFLISMERLRPPRFSLISMRNSLASGM